MKLTKCTRCYLCKTRNKVVRGTGPTTRRRDFWLGEAPGRTEDFTGWSFSGRSEKVLAQWMDIVGTSRKRSRVSNCVHCRPCDSRLGENRKPTPAELAACELWLRKEILALYPRLIITLGNTAFTAISGTNEEFSSHVGRIFWSRTWRCWVFPLFHPAGMRTNERRKQNAKALKVLQKVYANLESLENGSALTQLFIEEHLQLRPESF